VIKLTLGSGSAVNWKDVIHGKENIDPSFYSLKQEFSLFNGIACGYVNRTDNSDVCQAVMMTMSLPPTKFSYRYNYIIERILPHLLMIRSNAANELTCNENILSTRELEVLRWVKEGKSSWEIGEILSISERTVKFHLSNIFRKLNVISRAQAVAKSLQYGYLEL
jgi:LuxR family quorum sensing-dependent transcriptional regulator